MKLTKFTHACVLVEDSEHATLFDPGQFAWESGLFRLDSLDKLDYVIITHEHFDHFHPPFVEALHKKFPQVKFITTEAVVMKLEDMGIKNATEEPDDYVKVTYLAHESMAPLNPNTPQNIMVHYKNAITHPGDSLQLKKTKDILFLPLAGPWGSAIGAVRMAERLRPKTIVPIHDWMWNEEWRSTMYKWLEQFFGEMGIRFIPAVDGKAFEV